jgi:hypothetical protein
MKLIAANIGNLTDARFFAAYLPELLIMPAREHEELHEQLTWLGQVKPWIEGPRWGLVINSQLTEADLFNITVAGISTLVHASGIKDQHRYERFENIILISTPEDLTDRKVDKVDGIICTSPAQVSNIVALSNSVPIYVVISELSQWNEIVLWRSDSTEVCARVVSIGRRVRDQTSTVTRDSWRLQAGPIWITTIGRAR